MKNLLLKSCIVLFFSLLTNIHFAQTWIQRGQNIDGITENDYMGTSASMSSDGSVIITGADGSNYVKVYELTGGTWVQKGSTIFGDENEDRFGSSVRMSSDGQSFIVGAEQSTTSLVGYARVYQWNGVDWEEKGQKLITSGAGVFGKNVEISDNGAVIAVAGKKLALVYFWNGVSWIQMGQDISLSNISNVNEGIALDYDGSVVATAGKVFDYIGDQWVQRGEIVGGGSIDLNEEGSRVITGNPNNQKVTAFEWQTDHWELLGDTLTAFNWLNERFGSAVFITPDGKTIAIADHYGQLSSGYNEGIIYVYDWNGTTWVKRDKNIVGNASLGNLGHLPTSIDLSDNGKYFVGGAYGVNSQAGRTTSYVWCPGTKITQTAMSCGSGYTWSINNQTYTTDGSYQYTVVDSDGCNVYYTLELTFSDTASVDTTVRLCDDASFTWDASGLTYASDGIFKDTISGLECPTIYTMDFKKGLSSTEDQSLTICNSYYLWPANNQVYTTSGNYQAILTNQYGCDSIINLDLIIYPVPDVEETVYSCSSMYNWAVNGKTYSVEGIYKDTTSSIITGCDSINTLNLFFQETSLSILTSTYASFTSPYTNTKYTTTGVYTENFNLNGCAVTYTIDLTIKGTDPLNGTYTIDQSGAGDFISFSDAAEALEILGVDGAVIFDVKEDTYDETFALDSIPGSSEVNTVTFIGENENVVMKPVSIPNNSQFILLNQISNISFESIQFIHEVNTKANMIVLNGPASGFRVENCLFSFIYEEEDYSYFQEIIATDVTQLIVRNNDFSGGITSLFTTNCESIIYENNHTHDVWLYTSNNITVRNNDFNHSGYAYGIYIQDCDEFIISENKINYGGYNLYPTLYIHYKDPSITPANPSVISNNFIFTPETIEIKAMDSLTFVHNTIVSQKGGLVLKRYGVGSPCAYNSEIKNNIIVAGEGDVIATENEFENVEIDYNLYYTSAPDQFITYGNTSFQYANLTDWHTAYPANDANSQFFEPVFTATDDLHILSETDYRFGDPSVGIASDIDGDSRSLTSAVDVGADEYVNPLTGNLFAAEDKASLILYPVPAQNYIHFITDRNIVYWEIASLCGLTVKKSQKENLSGSIETNLEGMESGMYFLKITDSQGKSMIGKFIKE